MGEVGKSEEPQPEGPEILTFDTKVPLSSEPEEVVVPEEKLSHEPTPSEKLIQASQEQRAASKTARLKRSSSPAPAGPSSPGKS
jgi:hypothetical protein